MCKIYIYGAQVPSVKGLRGVRGSDYWANTLKISQLTYTLKVFFLIIVYVQKERKWFLRWLILHLTLSLFKSQPKPFCHMAQLKTQTPGQNIIKENNILHGGSVGLLVKKRLSRAVQCGCFSPHWFLMRSLPTSHCICVEHECECINMRWIFHRRLMLLLTDNSNAQWIMNRLGKAMWVSGFRDAAAESHHTSPWLN